MFGNLSPLIRQQNILLNTNIIETQIDNKIAGYLGILLTELCINSLKHAFLDVTKPTITCIIEINEGTLKMKYTDNGKGLDDNETPSLVDLLCQQLESKYEIINNAGFNIKVQLSL